SLRRPLSILDIGCGTGYDLEVLREVFPAAEVKSIVCCDISPEMLARARPKAEGYACRFIVGDASHTLDGGPYDLAVTHALVHHIPDLAAFFHVLRQAVVAGGGYVMGHEPNRRHWNNVECRAVLETFNRARRRTRRLRKCLAPRCYVAKALRMLGWLEPNNLESSVNRALR